MDSVIHGQTVTRLERSTVPYNFRIRGCRSEPSLATETTAKSARPTPLPESFYLSRIRLTCGLVSPNVGKLSTNYRLGGA